jgi:predicted ArsR family transcriptional regulator
MLKGIFGNETTEKVLLHLLHYGESHASAIAHDFDLALTPVRGQLDRLESTGVIVSKEVGRSRVYFFNPKSPYAAPLQALIEVLYQSIPLREREAIFKTRRRPRRKGKPVL